MSLILDLVGSILPYSLKPWEWQSSNWQTKDIDNVSHKVVLVTGANGGVGLETCFELFRNGAHIVMGCRTKEKFNVAKAKILSRLNKEEHRGRLTYLQADTSTINSSQQAAKDFLRNESIDRLDVFIACAGRGSTVGPKNQDGVEPFMATNCLGHLALLLPLLPLMVKTSKSSPTSCRVVFVSSVAEQWSTLPWPMAITPTFSSWEDVNDSRRGERGLYSASKLAQILTIKKLNQEVSAENISCLALHPGELNNNFVKEMIPKAIYPYMKWMLQRLLLDEHEGARTCLYAATSRDIDDKQLRGSYISYPTQVKEPSRLATNMDLAEALWRLQMQIIQGHSRKGK